MKKTRKMQTWLVIMSFAVILIITVFQYIIWRYTCRDIIAAKTQQLFDEVNYQYAQQLDDRLGMCKKIADGIKSNETIKGHLLRLNANMESFFTCQSHITSEVMKQLNTVSVNMNVVKGVSIHSLNGYTIQCYSSANSIKLDIGNTWTTEQRPQLFDYDWHFDSENDKLYILTYVIDGTRLIGLLELDLIDDLFSGIVSSRSSDLEMLVTIQDRSGICYYNSVSEESPSYQGDIRSSIRFNDGQWTLESTLPSRYVNQEIQKFSNLYVPSFLVLTIILMFILLGTHRSILKPLHQVILGMKNMQKWNWEFRLPEMQWAELNQVNSSFNDMAATLQNYLVTIDNQNKKLRELSTLSHASKFNPHFVFNTLDMIRWELELANRPSLGQLIVKFSNLLRYSVSTGAEITTIERDLLYIEHYLDINKSLFGDKLSYQIEIDERVGMCATPKLLVQPLVENALKHAFDSMKVPGIIVIQARGVPEGIRIDVIDNGHGMDPARIDMLNQALENWSEDGEEIIRSNGLGLFLVNSIIKHYYGPDYGIRLNANDYGGLTVVLRLSRLYELCEKSSLGG